MIFHEFLRKITTKHFVLKGSKTNALELEAVCENMEAALIFIQKQKDYSDLPILY
jgi:hypothetical protein